MKCLTTQHFSWKALIRSQFLFIIIVVYYYRYHWFHCILISARSHKNAHLKHMVFFGKQPIWNHIWKCLIYTIEPTAPPSLLSHPPAASHRIWTRPKGLIPTVTPFINVPGWMLSVTNIIPIVNTKRKLRRLNDMVSSYGMFQFSWQQFEFISWSKMLHHQMGTPLNNPFPWLLQFSI